MGQFKEKVKEDYAGVGRGIQQVGEGGGRGGEGE